MFPSVRVVLTQCETVGVQTAATMGHSPSLSVYQTIEYRALILRTQFEEALHNILLKKKVVSAFPECLIHETFCAVNFHSIYYLDFPSAQNKWFKKSSLCCCRI